VVRRAEGRDHGLVARAALEAEGPLPDRRQRDRHVDQLARPLGATESPQPGVREHGGVELTVVDLANARVDVAAQGHVLEIGAHRAQQHAASQARGAHLRPGGQIGELAALARDQRIARIFAGRDRREDEARRQLGRDVLHRMHGEIGLAGDERFLDLLEEDAFAADLVERAIDDAVAGGDDVLLFDRHVGARRDQGICPRTRLREGQHRLSGGEDELHFLRALSLTCSSMTATSGSSNRSRMT
jgi:hypothetical protein